MDISIGQHEEQGFGWIAWAFEVFDVFEGPLEIETIVGQEAVKTDQFFRFDVFSVHILVVSENYRIPFPINDHVVLGTIAWQNK